MKKGMIIHLPFIATPSVIARSCLIGQYLPTVGSKMILVCGHFVIMYVCSICSSAFIFLCISNVLYWCSYQNIYCHTECVYADTHTSYFLGLCFEYYCDGIASLLWLDLVKVCIICVHCIGKCTALYIVATMTGLQYLCWQLPQMVCDLLFCLFPWQNSSGAISPHHEVFQGSLTLVLLYCHSTADKHLVINSVGKNAVLSRTSHSKFILSLTCERLAPRPVPEASVSRYRGSMQHRISCMKPAWLCFWPCHVTPDTCLFVIILSSPIWTSIGVHIPKQSLVRTYLGNGL